MMKTLLVGMVSLLGKGQLIPGRVICSHDFVQLRSLIDEAIRQTVILNLSKPKVNSTMPGSDQRSTGFRWELHWKVHI